MDSKYSLVVGGAGYIGSHTVRLLLEEGFKVLVLDNFSTGHSYFCEGIDFIKGDMADESLLKRLFTEYNIDCVFHFSANSLVGESTKKPLLYYENNFSKTLSLIKMMLRFGVYHFVFSSTCAIYGIPDLVPISETESIKPINPYGHSKAMVEQLLLDLSATSDLNYVALRYFNAAGAWHEKGIGEWHHPETHLIPLILDACMDSNKPLTVFGDDYNTPDGTCIRDYIHVRDLAKAHVLALQYLKREKQSNVFNLGTSQGFSVHEMISVAEEKTGLKASLKKGARRLGDPEKLIANASKAKDVLAWKLEFSDVEQVISDAWAWHQHLQKMLMKA